MSYTASIKAHVAILEVLRRGGGGGDYSVFDLKAKEDEIPVKRGTRSVMGSQQRKVVPVMPLVLAFTRVQSSFNRK